MINYSLQKPAKVELFVYDMLEDALPILLIRNKQLVLIPLTGML